MITDENVAETLFSQSWENNKIKRYMPRGEIFSKDSPWRGKSGLQACIRNTVSDKEKETILSFLSSIGIDRKGVHLLDGKEEMTILIMHPEDSEMLEKKKEMFEANKAPRLTT